MKTQISQFCNEFSEVLAPLSATLQQSIDGLNQVKDGQSLGDVLPGLADVSLRLRALTDKVEGQEAYVLVFGPLKSGKSTLLNAISSAYVSEVTSLPAYPCMVHVKYADTPNYTLHRYDGSTQTVSGGEGLRDRIEEAHLRLAQRLREVEDEGGQFETARDLPEAIRRIVVELPAENLRESGTVLVDTPGLYSRMKFGYDLMTREFRNSAASAVFVVKTDNLFLEQVFADFNDLLGMFSRVFVVVNLDGNKMDLGPDGTLTPSLEKEDPGRIIEAFESLTMSAELRRAMEAGRLRIYPVDLLQAASASLRGESAEDGDPFGAFLGDLTEYLNSTDYMTEFMGDSLRQGGGLCEEIAAHQESAALQQVHERQQSLENQLGRLDGKFAAIDGLEQFDWDAAFNPLRSEYASTMQTESLRFRGVLSTALDGALNDWFDSDESLVDLSEKRLAAILADTAKRVAERTQTRLEDLTASPQAGAELSQETTDRLELLGLSLQSICESRSEPLSSESPDLSTWRIDIRADDLPIQRTLWDLVLFRGESTVRTRILGPTERPDSPIPAAIKQSRLHNEGREWIGREIEQHVNRLFPAAIEDPAGRLVDRYAAAVREDVEKSLSAAKSGLSDERSAIDGQIENCRSAVSLLERLAGAVSVLHDSVGKLAERYECGRDD
jgi:hypothetical protein